MNTDLVEGWLSSKLFDGETAVLVTLLSALVIKLVGYMGTLMSTLTAMFYTIRGGYRAVSKWKTRRLERAVKREAEYIQKVAHMAAAEVARLTTQQSSKACVDYPPMSPLRHSI